MSVPETRHAAAANDLGAKVSRDNLGARMATCNANVRGLEGYDAATALSAAEPWGHRVELP